MTPEAARFGNNLYFWLAAWRQGLNGQPLWLTPTRAMTADLRCFPRARRFILEAEDLRRFDARLQVPGHHFQRFGVDFAAHDLQGFVADVVLDSREFQRALERAYGGTDDECVHVHIRRGDYYSDDRYRPRYAMDVENYLNRAVSLARDTWGIHSVCIVSDDPDWCKSHLESLEHLGVRVAVPDALRPSLDDFAALCCASHLILSNSSFSQWGAHVNSVLTGGASRVIAPSFGVRGINSGRAWQLNPDWLLVDNAEYECARAID